MLNLTLNLIKRDEEYYYTKINLKCIYCSSPTTKAKLRKVPPMPYEFWTNILAYKMTSWFKIYRAKHEDATKVRIAESSRCDSIIVHNFPSNI